MKKHVFFIAMILALFCNCGGNDMKATVEEIYNEAIASEDADINKILLTKYGSESLVDAIKELDNLDEGGGMTYYLYYGSIVENSQSYCSDFSMFLRNQKYTINDCSNNTAFITFTYDLFQRDYEDEEKSNLEGVYEKSHKLIMVEEGGKWKIDDVRNNDDVSLRQLISEAKAYVKSELGLE